VCNFLGAFGVIVSKLEFYLHAKELKLSFKVSTGNRQNLILIEKQPAAKFCQNNCIELSNPLFSIIHYTNLFHLLKSSVKLVKGITND